MDSQEWYGVVLEEGGDFIIANALQHDRRGLETAFISPGLQIQRIPDSDNFPGEYTVKPVPVSGGVYPEGNDYNPDNRVLRLGILDGTEKERKDHSYFVNHPRQRRRPFQLVSEGKSEAIETFKNRNCSAEVSEDAYPVTDSLENHQTGEPGRTLAEASRELEDSAQLKAVYEILNGNPETEEKDITGYYTQGGNKYLIEGEIRLWRIDDESTVFFNGYVEENEVNRKDAVTGLIQNRKIGIIKTPEPHRDGYEVIYVAEESMDRVFEGEWMLNKDQYNLNIHSGEVKVGIDEEVRHHELSEFAS